MHIYLSSVPWGGGLIPKSLLEHAPVLLQFVIFYHVSIKS